MIETIAIRASTLLLAFLLLSSCSQRTQLTAHDGFQKRKYLKGHYHISKSEPASSVRKERTSGTENTAPALLASMADEPIEASKSQRSTGVPRINSETNSESQQGVKSEGKSIQKQLRSIVKELRQSKRTSVDTSQDERNIPEEGTKLNVVGLIGFICAILGIATLAMGYGFSILLAVAALVLGIVSVGDFKQKPDTYKGRGLALTALIVGATMLVLLVVALFLLARAFNGGF